MLCFRVILWGRAALVALIPFCFLVGIIGRVAGFRPGSQAGTTEKAFGWFGIVLLGGIILCICLVAGFVDWGVTSAMMRNPRFAHQFQPQPAPMPRPQAKPIPPNWLDKQMKLTYLADMQEFNVSVGWGGFGKKGKLGYRCAYGEDVQVDGKKWPNAISTHPPSFGVLRVSYRLERNARLFKSWCALSDADAGFRLESHATFNVFGDGVLLWTSAPVRLNKQIEECRINVEGVDTLELQVHCPGPQGSVRAVWLEPHVLR